MMTVPTSLYISLVMTERDREARQDYLAAIARRARDCCQGTGSRLRRLLTRAPARNSGTAR
jgi:hypothetical protein